MTYQVLIRPEAELDLEEAYKWYEQRSRGLGSEFVRAIDASLSMIQRNPLAYSTIYKQVRRKIVRRFPYGIFYFLEDQIIVVVACIHVKRDFQQWKQRLI